MLKELMKKKKSNQEVEPVYKHAKMSVLSDIANMASRSMGEDLKSHPKKKPLHESLVGKDAEEVKKALLKHADSEGHNKESADMLDMDQEEDHVHGTDAPSEQESSRYAKGGVVDYENSEEKEYDKPKHGRSFEFGKESKNAADDLLREHTGIEQEEKEHEEEEGSHELNEKNASKYGKKDHEEDPEEEADELSDLSEEDIKAMMDHLDKKLKSKWQQNK
jgi:hypothetical protein